MWNAALFAPTGPTQNSFADEEEDEDEDEGIAEVGKKQRTAEDTETCERGVRGGVDPAGPSVAGNRPGDAGAPRRLGKNPLVDTSFLPDDERDKRERELREGLRKKWLAEQDRIKVRSAAWSKIMNASHHQCRTRLGTPPWIGLEALLNETRSAPACLPIVRRRTRLFRPNP